MGQNPQLKMLSETLYSIQSNPQEQEWKEKERAMMLQLENMEMCNSMLEAELGRKEKDIDTLKTALKETSKLLVSTQDRWMEEKTQLLEETEILRKALQMLERDLKDKELVLMCQQTNMDSCTRLLEDQLDEQFKELTSSRFALKEAKQELEKNKAVLGAQTENTDNCISMLEDLLEKQSKELNSLKADLREAGEQLESKQIFWEETNRSLLQEMEALTNDLQSMRQDLAEKEEMITSQKAKMDCCKTFLDDQIVA